MLALATMGERVRWARSVSGLAARELGERAGCTGALVSMIENGKRTNTTSEIATGIARALGVSLDWLVNGEGHAPSERAIRAAVDVKHAS